ncbi:methylated-DNA--[protein]-cysteine S-methyltransferase [Diaminobutyricimonas sp. TR449]|uniref:methylated-DNA--[protein]-cysteine S-methyltransferase n=1 Tax=Diaminobutyricimonas sp. TR449 TaxID=2708076 RepID=UPI001422F009|nr:methylated-DNA--[protein]-cysteine S-methyltransferase [Diaminobutyricimonas sp. TR449]
MTESLSPPAPPAFLRRLDSPLGRVELTANGDYITSLSIERDHTLPHDHLDECGNRLIDRAARQVSEYLIGSRRAFTLPVELGGTPFQKAVWHKLQSVKCGQVTSYGAIAAAIGHAAAGRAVGAAVAANPIPLIVPCHRVLGAGRMVTGYSQGSGVATKLWLLEHERIHYKVSALTSAGEDAATASEDVTAAGDELASAG